MHIFYGIVFLVMTFLLASVGFSRNKYINAATIFCSALLGCLWVMVPGIVPMLCLLTICFFLAIGGVSEIEGTLTGLILSIPAGIKLGIYLVATLNS
jgi:hypothetical protein